MKLKPSSNLRFLRTLDGKLHLQQGWFPLHGGGHIEWQDIKVVDGEPPNNLGEKDATP